MSCSKNLIIEVEKLNLNKTWNLTIATAIKFGSATIEDIQKMLRSEEYKEHPKLFTSTTLAKAKIDDISMLLKMSCWQDERFKDLLTCTIVSKAKQMIKKMPVLIELAEEYQIDKNLTTGFLCFSPSQNYALIRF